MVPFLFKHVYLESYATHFPDTEVSSTEIEARLAPVYERFQIPPGTLETITGIRTRCWWDKSVLASQAATVAAERALDGIGFDRSQIQALLSCSVTRDVFEPATACLVHRNLGLPEESVVYDISNACVGFSNGLTSLASMIELGVVGAGLVVAGENPRWLIESHIAQILSDPSLTKKDLVKLMSTLTLGSGAAAFVLCHERLASRGHRVIGSVARAATQHSDLCRANGDFVQVMSVEQQPLMLVETTKLVAASRQLGSRAWRDASALLGWKRADVDHVFAHQIGKQTDRDFYNELGLDSDREHPIYEKYGNLVSAALPAALALGVEERKVRRGDKVLLLGFGGGINAVLTGISW